LPCLTVHRVLGGKKTQVWLPGGSKFCSWASENGSLVVCLAREISPSSLVSDNFKSEKFQNLWLQDEQNNELKAWINWKLSILPSHSLCTYWASNILVGATENWNILAHSASGFQNYFPAMESDINHYHI